MPELAIFGILSGRRVGIHHHKCIRRFSREVLPFTSAISVREGEVHWGNDDIGLVEGVLPEQGFSGRSLAS